MLNILPGIPGIWPVQTLDEPRATLRALVAALSATERLSASDLCRLRSTQLQAVVDHAARFSPHFAARLRSAGLCTADIDSLTSLARLPVLGRRELQANGPAIECSVARAVDGDCRYTSTSGSTGEPVRVKRTALTELFWRAFTIREHLWHRRDAGHRLAVIRANLPFPQPKALRDWGPPLTEMGPTGPAFAMPINIDVEIQLDWLNAVAPHYLLTYPNNLAALVGLVERQPARRPASLLQIRTIGETVSDALRARVFQVLGMSIADSYSSQELGLLAIQCDVSGLYHAMDEGYVLEVLDAAGEPCAEGETGRVVVTDLKNFAMPLIRYDIGDRAVAGGYCRCGRSLSTIRQFLGRERNLAHVAGKRHWPLLGFDRFREIGPILQYQVIQLDEQALEVRLVCETRLDVGQQTRLAEVIRQALGHRFDIAFTFYADRLPLSASGKFEEFVCLIDSD